MRRLAPASSAILSLVSCALFGLAAAPARATVVVYGPDSGAQTPFFGLAIPPVGGAFDERGWSGFEFLMSGLDPVTQPFLANEMYLIQGNDTNESQAIGIDLGTQPTISGVPFNFSIEQNLVGGRNFTFTVENTVTHQTSALCWGQNCAAGTVSQQIINGEGPFDAYNGLLVQIRSQDVIGSSVTLQLNDLSDITESGNALYSGTVNPTSPGTLSLFDTGRQGQLLIADNLEFLTAEWALQGTVTLNRSDAATNDRSKVRIAVDLVRDPNKPFTVPVPEASSAWLLGLGLIGMAARTRRAI